MRSAAGRRELGGPSAGRPRKIRQRESLPMRLLIITSLCLAAIAATPASAQVQQTNPNAANRSMETGGQLRALRQEQTTQSNTLRMDIQRNQAATPAPNTGPNAIGPTGGTGVIGR